MACAIFFVLPLCKFSLYIYCQKNKQYYKTVKHCFAFTWLCIYFNAERLNSRVHENRCCAAENTKLATGISKGRNRSMPFNIVLVEPEIPQNTGNIARTCAATGAVLHLVGPLGFKIEDRYLKRAGLDYWDKVNVQYYESYDKFVSIHNTGTFYYATTRATKWYCDVNYPDGCYILFGRETAGLPEELLKAHPERCIRIPMREGLRSLNLSNSAAIILYEALRQNGFAGLK